MVSGDVGWRLLGGQGTERIGVDVSWEVLEMGDAGGDGVERRGLFEEKSSGRSSGGLGKEGNWRWGGSILVNLKAITGHLVRAGAKSGQFELPLHAIRAFGDVRSRSGNA